MSQFIARSFLASVFLAGCGGSSEPDGGRPDAMAATDAAQAQDAAVAPDAQVMADASPPTDAGDGCTVSALPPLTTEVVVPGYGWESPLFLTNAPGTDDLFVVEQPGRIQRIRGAEVSVFLDISATTRFGGERGLLGLAFHPDYETNGRFFVYYTPRTPDTNRIAEYARSESDPDVADANEVAVLVDIDDPEANHNGGMLAFGPDGYLYAGTGDGGGSGDRHGAIGNGLDRNTLMGKVLRLDVDAVGNDFAAEGNPFSGDEGLPQIWAYGLRNPWRFSFDRLTGDLYIGDVGQNQFEEIDFQPASSTGGENYGWRAYEGFSVFSPSDVDAVPEHAEPIVAYPRTGGPVLAGSCSVTGGYVYRGDAIPALRGWYLFGDFCTERRAALRVCDGEAVGLTEVDGLSGRPRNLSSFGEDAAGELYMLGSTVVRIIPG